MSTQVATDAKEPVETKPAEKSEKEPTRSVNVNLRDGHGSRLKIAIKLKKDGTATTFAVHSVKEGKKWRNTRGATEVHAKVESAKAEFEKLVAQALKAGWVRKERSGGFKAKPDAFDSSHLPSPKTAKKA